MAEINNFNGKQVVIKIRDMKPILAAVSTSDEHGIWIRGAGDLLSTATDIFQRAAIQQPHYFVPWTSVDWVSMQNQ
jgi:hypothetical protein